MIYLKKLKYPFLALIITGSVLSGCKKTLVLEPAVNTGQTEKTQAIAGPGQTIERPNLPSTIYPIYLKKKFLFDATKHENAGNADWQIDGDGTEMVASSPAESKAQRYPTPAQSGITPSTPETYWKGALSAWAIDLVKLGGYVETLPSEAKITYGDSTNPQDLKNYNVYIVVEPNVKFTASEKTAILNFVKNGGGLMMVSDHDGSDRDNDGADSPMVWDDLMLNNPFGFSIDHVNVSPASPTVYVGPNASAQKILNGLGGPASKLAFHNGTTATLVESNDPNANVTVQGLFWLPGTDYELESKNGVMALCSTYYKGRVAFIGDSSTSDDGTGDPGDKLFNGWSGDVYASTSHSALQLNASLWLAK